MRLTVRGTIEFQGDIYSAGDWQRLDESIELFRGHTGAAFQDIQVKFVTVMTDEDKPR